MLKNTYENCEDYSVIITQNGERIIVDTDKIEQLKHYRWQINEQGYAVCWCKIDGKFKRICLHRLLLNMPKGVIIDHKDRNKLNNRLSNLREVSSSENNRNNSKRKDNTSGITGVYWDKRKKLWRAVIHINSANKHLIRTKDKELAIRKRLEAELKYYGKEFAPQRDLFEKYNII